MLKLRLGIRGVPVRVDKLTRLEHTEVYWACRTSHIVASHRRCHDITRNVQLIILSLVSGAWWTLLARNLGIDCCIVGWLLAGGGSSAICNHTPGTHYSFISCSVCLGC